jgi:L-amino acid N-acyltransferase YncA
MQFYNAGIDDLPLIVDIYNSTIAGRMVTADTEEVTVADKRPWFESHNTQTRPIWMVKKDDNVIGWVSFKNFYGRPAYSGTAEISIYLHPQARGKGYGKSILQYCIQQSPTLQIHTLLGFIFSHNEASKKLFKNAGFTEWGMLKDIAIMDDQHYSLSIFGLKTM